MGNLLQHEHDQEKHGQVDSVPVPR
jgi:hypothetical protein